MVQTGTDVIAERIALIRQQVCPRTSYATSGAASTVAIMVACGGTLNSSYCQSLRSDILSTKEFDEVEQRVDHRSQTNRIEIIQDQIQGHVVISVNPDECSLSAAIELVLKRKTTLLFIFMTPTAENHVLNAQDVLQIVKRSPGDHVSSLLDNFDSFQLITVYSSSPPKSCELLQENSLGHNKQPSVQTRQQFKFLWTSKGNVDGKNRVLQRLADKSLLDGVTKYSKDKWESLIRNLLQKGGDDYAVYSLLREYYIGKNLEDSLKIQIPSLEEGRKCVLKNEHENDNEGEDGRANYMVEMTLECLPLSQDQKTPIKVQSMLDYGCAEGAITAQLCRRLQVNPSRAFGADVRSLRPKGFSFVLLPAEGPEPSSEQLLPMLETGSLDLITSAMVFHHVTHAKAAISEIRRLISPKGAFIMREHHCTSPDMGAFLDIIHGLYSLAWKDPVEDPRFLEEYKAYYRGREEWNALIESCGFLKVDESKLGWRSKVHYNAAVNSNTKSDGSIKNVIRAYYAAYLPDPAYVLPVRRVSTTGRSGVRASDGGDDLHSNKRVRTECNNSGSGSGSSSDNGRLYNDRANITSSDNSTCNENKCEIFESKKYLGKYYTMNAVSKEATWIEVVPNSSDKDIKSLFTSSSKIEDFHFFDVRRNKNCGISKAHFV